MTKIKTLILLLLTSVFLFSTSVFAVSSTEPDEKKSMRQKIASYFPSDRVFLEAAIGGGVIFFLSAIMRRNILELEQKDLDGQLGNLGRSYRAGGVVGILGVCGYLWNHINRIADKEGVVDITDLLFPGTSKSGVKIRAV